MMANTYNGVRVPEYNTRVEGAADTVRRDRVSGVVFSIGSGFTESQRADMYANRDTLPGRLVKYKSFNIGVKEKPRFPIFLGFRSPLDL